MTENGRSFIPNFDQERGGSLPAPITEGVDGAGNTIASERLDRVTQVTVARLMEVINNVPGVEVGMFKSNPSQG